MGHANPIDMHTYACANLNVYWELSRNASPIILYNQNVINEIYGNIVRYHGMP